MYLTGQGTVTAAVATGSPARASHLTRTAYPVLATLAGRTVEITFAGLSPGSAGLFQVTVRVPAIKTGTYPLVVTVNGVSSNAAIIDVSGN